MGRWILIYDEKNDLSLRKKNGQVRWFFTKLGAWLYLKRRCNPAIRERFKIYKLGCLK